MTGPQEKAPTTSINSGLNHMVPMNHEGNWVESSKAARQRKIPQQYADFVL